MATARKSSRTSASKATKATKQPSRSAITSDRRAIFTVPTLTSAQGAKVADALQERLGSLIDLSLTLKHIHWNVVGPNFISVHQMLDPQYAGVSLMADETAERIATLGGSPSGVPGKLVERRTWDDYSLDRADSITHLAALDVVYEGVIGGHRAAIDAVGDIDAMTEDMLVGQTRELEKYQWFVRSHLLDWAGGMANVGERTELGAARSASRKTSRSPQRLAAAGRD